MATIFIKLFLGAKAPLRIAKEIQSFIDKKFQIINRLQISKCYTLEGKGDRLQQVISLATVTYGSDSWKWQVTGGRWWRPCSLRSGGKRAATGGRCWRPWTLRSRIEENIFSYMNSDRSQGKLILKPINSCSFNIVHYFWGNLNWSFAIILDDETQMVWTW